MNVVFGSELRTIIITPYKHPIHLVNYIDKSTAQFNLFNVGIFEVAFHLGAVEARLEEWGELMD